MPSSVTVLVNGNPVTVPAEVSVAAAVARAGQSGFRRSVSGEPRAPVCGMGVCFECRVTIDGESHQRSCQIAAHEGMAIATERWHDLSAAKGVPVSDGSRPSLRSERATQPTSDKFDALIIGAGPAGLAAAVCAAESGKSVGLMDDNPDLGGQIWRVDPTHAPVGPAAEWFARVRQSSVTVLSGSQVVGQLRPGQLLLQKTGDGELQVGFALFIRCKK